MQVVFIGPLLGEGRLKLIETIHHLIHLAHGEFENLCFISVVPTVCLSRAFVYNVVNVNEIVIISSTKPPSYSDA